MGPALTPSGEGLLRGTGQAAPRPLPYEAQLLLGAAVARIVGTVGVSNPWLERSAAFLPVASCAPHSNCSASPSGYLSASWSFPPALVPSFPVPHFALAAWSLPQSLMHHLSTSTRELLPLLGLPEDSSLLVRAPHEVKGALLLAEALLGGVASLDLKDFAVHDEGAQLVPI